MTLPVGAYHETLDHRMWENQRMMVGGPYLPRELRPNREVFLALGFTIEKPIDDLLTMANIPAGWTRVATSSARYIHIQDNRGRNRVEVFYSYLWNEKYAWARILPRFTWEGFYGDPRKQIEPIGIIIRDAGIECAKFLKTEPLPDEGNKTGRLKADAFLMSQLLEWFDKHRPLYRDPMAYWDET